MRLLLYKHKSVMKRILFMIILGLGGLMPVNRTLAQRAVDLFQAYSWEQASLQAGKISWFWSKWDRSTRKWREECRRNPIW